MDNTLYTLLTRQSGLMREMSNVANNIANASTTGYRTESIVFSEHVKSIGQGQESLSMATATNRHISSIQGALTLTDGTFDLAIEGTGFFQIQTPEGPRLTRAGHFTPNENGDLTNPEGHLLLDTGNAPIFVPPNASSIGIAPDGTVSADGAPVGQIGVVRPLDDEDLVRTGGTAFTANQGVEADPNSSIAQGYLEDSNVDQIHQISRMIEVQRAYELGQSLMDKEDQRVRAVIEALGRQS